MRLEKNRIVSSHLPALREKLDMEGFGKVEVLSLYRTQSDNYIVLKYHETVLDSPPIFAHRFTVEP